MPMIDATVVASPMRPVASSSILQDPALAPWVNASPTHLLATSKPIVAECGQPSLTSTLVARASVGANRLVDGKHAVAIEP
jgi:hypothetical protein